MLRKEEYLIADYYCRDYHLGLKYHRVESRHFITIRYSENWADPKMTAKAVYSSKNIVNSSATTIVHTFWIC